MNMPQFYIKLKPPEAIKTLNKSFLILLIYIVKGKVSKINWEIEYIKSDFLWFSSVPSGEL
jgi:hypothetical protein